MRLWLSLCLLSAAYAAAPKPLAIEQIVLSQFEDGPPIPTDYYFVPGDTVFFSFHVAGYKAVGDEDPRVSLTYTIEARDAAKVAIMEPDSGLVDTTLVTEDKDWTPKVRLRVPVPPYAPSGTYSVQVIVRDRVAQRQAVGQATFRVKGHDFEPSETLVVRNFHFYRGEEDQHPLTTPAYHGGDSLWARFEITGYKFGPKNEFDVSYGLELLRPNGGSVFRQADAAKESKVTFYPQRYVPAGMSLNLEKNIAPGEYTLVVLVSDKVGSQKVESRQVFTVE